MAQQYAAGYAFAMPIRIQVALVLALLASLAANAWLVLRAPSIEIAAATTTAPPEERGGASAERSRSSSDGEGETLQTFARVVEESKKARAAARERDDSHRNDADETTQKARALVDARVVLDAQCRHARGKAEEAFRRDGPGIRRFLLEDDKRTPEELARDLEQKKSELADVVGTEPSDARVQELATKRFTMERDARNALKAAVQTEPPDWRAAMDVVLDLYRKQDAEARRILGDEKAEEVMLADVDGRAGVLAIGSSLVGESWEAGATALTTR